jgi:uncharacterized damage-inducible protein DinB
MSLQAKREDLFQHYRVIRAELLAAIEGLSEEQMLEPSIDGWSVKDHLAHMAVWEEIRRLEIERISAGGGCAWSAMSEEQMDIFNELTVVPRRSMPLAQVLSEFDSSRQRVLDMIAQATERGLDESNYGESSLRTDHDLKHAEYIRNWRHQRGY